MKKGLLKLWTHVTKAKKYDHWECHFPACPNYDIVGSEHSCNGTLGRGCRPGRTGGEGCLMTWDEVRDGEKVKVRSEWDNMWD